MTSASPKKVVIVGHSERPEAAVAAQQAIEWLRAHGHEPLAQAVDIQSLGLDVGPFATVKEFVAAS